MLYPENSEFKARVEAFKSRMPCDFAIICHLRDIYYLAGTAQPSMLLVPKDGDPTIFFRMHLEKGEKETWIGDIRQGGVKEICELIKGGSLVGIEKDVLPVSIYESILKRIGGDVETTDVTPAILLTRMVKSRYEITMMEEAARISNAGHKMVRKALVDGISEIELATEVEYAMRKAGHNGFIHIRRWDGFLHYELIASGENLYTPSGFPGATITGVGLSRAFSYGPSSRKIMRGDLVMVDIGVPYRGYHSDEARMYVVGSPDKTQIERYSILLEIYEKVIPMMKPGNKVNDVYGAAFEVIEEHGYSDWFMGYQQFGVSYLGHGIGIEMNEMPLVTPGVDIILEEGITIALEPKLIVPGWGGVDLEDTFLITDNGAKFLTYTGRDLAEV
ncbi:MAG: hypothetical protein COZ68_10155 [Deltaproteobacteria bacterium CG_4_8_14_3_um_filter_43_13]|nr:MAG: hypothetical protein COS67_07725 [Deltaproteobacteria bacterium CG06_land_8_20_14_3_00_44_19]PIX23154.1 MAG: hypothetical protein COZ68_10155 [Deltaproteobacteria bacterium CG_4_8_14_3_um_filter_43_13]PIZ18419.1 MAG: hypothetical protein COY50_15400 [Deltaproteobacteria bacterium CG_4_10_14_0_8_um_filter_43_12]